MSFKASTDGIKVGKLSISSTDKIPFREKGYVLIGGKYKPKRLVTVKCINISYHPKNDGNKMDIENDEDEVENEDIKNDETKKKIEDEIKEKKKKINIEIKNEIDILIASDAHPHIIMFHGYESENDVAYLCIEKWKLNLDDLPKFAQKQLRKQTREV
ncbi:Inactive serine/threonine-protein kinase/endoribonuclease IRE1-like [Cardamine amara subsp. amara]|uniref:Inactive serine/threonine-protein kinase/endoribonuclease IRE1-like n=1 Tax=Cardamine amara subsp. amara TaxID=228776 RepID=A0ABD1ASR7_CARAN